VPAAADATTEPAIPSNFLCPISLEMMRDPVTAPTGITYDRDSVEGWLERGHSTCPVTARPLRAEDLVPNHATRRMIQEWCVANRALGVERVPTPRVPLSAADAAPRGGVRGGAAKGCAGVLPAGGQSQGAREGERPQPPLPRGGGSRPRTLFSVLTAR
jgi:hypothetical protein